MSSRQTTLATSAKMLTARRFEYDAPRWCDLSHAITSDTVDEWFNLRHPVLELSQGAYNLLMGDTVDPAVDMDEVTQLALEQEFEQTLYPTPVPPFTPPKAPPASPGPSPSKAVPRVHLLSPNKGLGAPRRVLAPMMVNQAHAYSHAPTPSLSVSHQKLPGPSTPKRTTAAIRFTAAPTK